MTEDKITLEVSDELSPEKIAEIIDEVVAENQKPKTAWEKLIDVLNESAKARINKQVMKWNLTHQHIDNIDTLKVKMDKETKKMAKVIVPVHRYVGWEYGKKYTGARLRQIRAERTAKALEGQTHYADGTPIIRDRVIDLPQEEKLAA